MPISISAFDDVGRDFHANGFACVVDVGEFGFHRLVISSARPSRGRRRSVAQPNRARAKVRKGGVEPPKPFGYRILSPARLPVPPLSRGSTVTCCRRLGDPPYIAAVMSLCYHPPPRCQTVTFLALFHTDVRQQEFFYSAAPRGVAVDRAACGTTSARRPAPRRFALS